MQLILRYLNEQSKEVVLLISMAILVVAGIVDRLSAPGLTLFIFHLLALIFSAWYCGRAWGLIFAFMGAAVWGIVTYDEAVLHASVGYHFFRGGILILEFSAAAWILAGLGCQFDAEEELADRDGLTGLFNKRSFSDILRKEVHRAKRFGHPVSLAYIDLDNFKQVNDRKGHHEGDRLLKMAASVMDQFTRQEDIAARVGGDEFAILLPETGSLMAEKAVSHVHKRLLEVMKVQGWAVTFSIGVVTAEFGETGEDELVQAADALMYRMKTSGKNQVAFSVLETLD